MASLGTALSCFGPRSPLPLTLASTSRQSSGRLLSGLERLSRTPPRHLLTGFPDGPPKPSGFCRMRFPRGSSRRRMEPYTTREPRPAPQVRPTRIRVRPRAAPLPPPLASRASSMGTRKLSLPYETFPVTSRDAWHSSEHSPFVLRTGWQAHRLPSAPHDPPRFCSRPVSRQVDAQVPPAHPPGGTGNRSNLVLGALTLRSKRAGSHEGFLPQDASPGQLRFQKTSHRRKQVQPLRV